MYIYLGEEVAVKSADVIAIIDKESINSSTYMDEFLHHCKDQSIHLGKDSFKSIIVTSKHIYYSPLATGTLKKKSQKLSVHEF